MTALPSWIDPEAWSGFVDMRRATKKPLTARAELLVVKTLYDLRAKGHDPNAALDQSTLHNWADVYQPQVKAVDNLNREYMTSVEPPMTEQQRAAADDARRLAMSAIRRVA